MSSRVSFTWSTRREGNNGFVLEECWMDGMLEYRKEFGPMPPHIVPTFARARRQITQVMQEEQQKSTRVSTQDDWKSHLS